MKGKYFSPPKYCICNIILQNIKMLFIVSFHHSFQLTPEPTDSIHHIIQTNCSITCKAREINFRIRQTDVTETLKQ